MSDEKFHIEPGMVISHFRLEKMLGEGGMGVVYLAEDITLNRKVAIKFMHKSMLASLPTQELREQVEQRFIREAKSVAGISHTNIAQVYEANFSSDNWYIVMEFIKGRPLDEILKEEGAFSIKDALRILEQTAKGLKYAWDNCKVVHRDIKPQNLMLTFDNYVKIVDLGLAKPVVEEESFDLTGVGIPVGTPFYMSPEQAVAGKVDYRADMFALGATVYELMSNTKTYMGKTQAMIYGKKIKQEYKCLTKFGFKANISELIDKLLEPTVADRYETWDELIYDIRLVRKGQPISKSQNIPDTFDPMQETLDENSSFGNPASNNYDPMTDTIDENTDYDLSKVKSSPEADPMEDTLDENTPYDLSKVKSSSETDLMEETLDENTDYDLSKVKSSPEADPMEDTLDENTPFDQTAVPKSKASKTPEAKVEETYLNCDVMAETMIPDKPINKPKASENKKELGKKETKQTDNKKSNVTPIIFSIFAVTAIAVYFILFNKPAPPENNWPAEDWKTYLANHEWLSTYHTESTIKELTSLNIKDSALIEFTAIIKDPNLTWLHEIYNNNKGELKFIPSPTEVEAQLQAQESIDKLKLVLLLQNDLIDTLKRLTLHEEIKEVNSELNDLKFTKHTLEISETPTCFELIDTYKKLRNARLWISRLKANQKKFKELESNKLLSSKLNIEYKNFLSSLNPLSTDLSTDIFSSKLKELQSSIQVPGKTEPTNTETKIKPELKLLEKPLKEIQEMISQLEQKYSEQQYSLIAKKIQVSEELLNKASEQEKQLLIKLKEKHQKLKRIEEQLFIHLDNPQRIDSRNSGPIKIIPNQDCYYVILYEINSESFAIRDPANIDNAKITQGQTKHTNSFRALKDTVEVICFTYKKDLERLYKLQKQNTAIKTCDSKEVNDLLKSLAPVHFDRKSVVIQKD